MMMQSPVLQRVPAPAVEEDPKESSDRMPGNEPCRSTTPPLPLDCEPLSHQVAGHVHGKGKTKIGMLQYKDGTILKPFQRPSRGQKEAAFYHRVFYPDPALPSRVSMKTLQQFIPCYYGTVAFKEDPTLYYLKLKDVTRKYRKPCIMDVKVGCQTYEDGATQFKKENAKIKYPNMVKVGFQISGMRIYYANCNKYEYFDKSYGRHFKEDTVIEGLKKFFQFDENFQLDAVTEILQLLYKLEDWFVHQCLFHFISSSILFVYEGDRGVDSVLTKESDTIPDLLPKNCISKVDELFVNGEATDANGVQDLWYVDHFDGEPIINGSVIRPRPISIQHVSGCTEVFKPNRRVRRENECNNGIGGKIIVVDRNQTEDIRMNDCLETTPCQFSDSKSKNGVVQENVCPNGTKCPERIPSCLVDLKMIDFTHVIEKPTQDDNYLFGLRKLISNLEILQGCIS